MNGRMQVFENGKMREINYSQKRCKKTVVLWQQGDENYGDTKSDRA